MDMVKAVATIPEIWERFSDGANKAEYYPSNTDRDQWILIHENGVTIGLIYVHCLTSVCLEMHPYLLKKYRHLGREMMRLFYLWFLESIPSSFQKIIVTIPHCFKPAVNMAVKTGFKSEGVNRHSYLFNGQYFDQEYLGITREEVENVVAK